MLVGLLCSARNMFVISKLFIHCFFITLLDFEAWVAKKMANICERYSGCQQSKRVSLPKQHGDSQAAQVKISS